MKGYVVRNQVPMFMSFDEEHVEFVCEHLAHAMERAYSYYAFFDMPDDGEFEED